MLSGEKLQQCLQTGKQSLREVAAAMVRPGLDQEAACRALRNWQRGLFKPLPTAQDMESLARALGVDRDELKTWSACHRYAPMAPRKVRLVTELIKGRAAQDALDVLKFANKRAAVLVNKVLRSAIANADEDEADLERLYVRDARVDEGGVRAGTRRWRPKDRGRAHSWLRLASHIHVTVDVD
ncbi:MAG: 50S ribosomal protein L22 [Sedimentisphaerales bacterium]|nr:50S ribosomal protein L22 [Sedimentisphaerales bacterium]